MPEELEKASEELTNIFMRMSGFLFTEDSLQSSLDRICELAHQTIQGTTGAGVTLVRGQKTFTAAHSDGLVVKNADDLQYKLGEGPCLSAIRDRISYRVDSMPDEGRWPKWAAGAAKMGLISALSVPLRVRGETIGAVKIYSDQPSHYTDRDERTVGMFGDQAAVVIANVLAFNDAQNLSDQLKEALETRDVIGMAKGILISQEGIDEDAAFTMLRQASQMRNVKLRDIARQLVTASAQKTKE